LFYADSGRPAEPQHAGLGNAEARGGFGEGEQV